MQLNHKSAIIAIITLLLLDNAYGLLVAGKDIKLVFLLSWPHIGSLPPSLSPSNSFSSRSLSIAHQFKQVHCNVVMKVIFNVLT